MSLTATLTLPASDLRTAASAGCSPFRVAMAHARRWRGRGQLHARVRDRHGSIGHGRPPCSLRSQPPEGALSARGPRARAPSWPLAAGRALMVHLLNLL